MKKNAFFTMICLLLAVWGQAQNLSNITGVVLKQIDNSPVANHEVYCFTGDSINPVFGSGLTDATGAYTISIDLPPGTSEVYVGTLTFCDPANPFETATVSLSNGQASADFRICADSFPPFPDCFADISYNSVDSLTLSFTGHYYSLLDSTEQAVSYLWDFGDGTTSTDANPTHTYNQSGLYVVNLTITGQGGCVAMGQLFVEVPFNNNPLTCFADFSILPVDSLTFQFTGFYYSFFDSSQAVSYLWDFGDGATSTDASPTHTYAQDGFYLVTLTIVGADGCEATAQYPFETTFHGFPECMGYILYNQTATTSFDFSGELYDANGNIITASSYNWDFGDGETSTDSNPSHTYAAEGVYTVQLHATTDTGCEIHACDVVFAFDCQVDTFWYGCQAMFATGPGGFDPNGNPTGGDPLTISFFDLSLGGVTSWSWNFGDSTTSTEQNPVHTYAQEGIYVVSLAITTVDGCESEVSFEICVGNNCWTPEFDCQALFIPIPDSLGGNGLQFLDLSFTNSPIQSWLWNFGDGTTSTEQNPYHVFAQPGLYTVSLTIEADSCNSVISFEIDTENPWNFNAEGGNTAKLGQSGSTLATHDAVNAFDSAKLFPNPAQNDVSVAFNSKIVGDYQVRITDLAGKTLVISQQQAVVGVNAARLNISNLVPGLYLAELRSGDAVQTIKFVKQ